MLFSRTTTELIAIYDKMQEAGVRLASAGEFADDACAIADCIAIGDRLTFLGSKSKLVEFRPGELTVLAGASGHGKSALMGQIALDLIKQDRKVCILSLEMPPGRTLWRMSRIEYGRRVCGWFDQYKDHAAELAERFCRSIDDKVVLLNKVGSADPKEVFGAMVKAHEIGCEHIIIDNLMRVCPEYGDRANELQKEFVQNLIALTKQFDFHTWLVHHVRKGSNETDEINKYSIRGAAAITDNADNVILLQRNISKEKKMADADDTARKLIDHDEADSVFIVDKQRNGEWQGTVSLWYDKDRMNFWPTSDRSGK